MNERHVPLSVIAVCALFCYGGPAFFRLGFYHDDWTLLAAMHFAPAGFGSWMAALVRDVPNLWFRPLEIPLYAALFGVSGLDPLGWQAFLLVVNAALAHAAWVVFRKLGLSATALGAAVVFLAYPSKDATMFWPIIVVNSLSLLLWLWATLACWRWLERGEPGTLAAAGGLLLGSLGLYDHCAALLPLWALDPKMGFKPSRRTFAALGVGAGVTAAVFAFKLWIVPSVLSIAFNKPLQLSLAQIAGTYGAGLASNLGPLLWSTAARALAEAPFTSALAAAATAFALWRSRVPAGTPSAAAPLFAFGLFVLGYALIAVSDYTPDPVTHLNRINQVPALGIVLAAALLLERRKNAAPALCAAAALLVASHAGFAGWWARSWERQGAVREVVRAKLADWPADATLLVMMKRYYVADKVPIFIAPWDIQGAVAVWSGDKSRTAALVGPNVEFRPDAVRLDGRDIPYAKVRLLEADRGILVPVGPRDFRPKT